MTILYPQLLKENFLKHTSNLHSILQQSIKSYFLSLKNLLKLFQQISKLFNITLFKIRSFFTSLDSPMKLYSNVSLVEALLRLPKFSNLIPCLCIICSLYLESLTFSCQLFSTCSYGLNPSLTYFAWCLIFRCSSAFLQYPLHISVVQLLDLSFWFFLSVP